jgi:hypothetical protein
MAVSEDTLPRRRTLRIARPGRKFIVFVASSTLGIALVVGGAIAYHQTLVGRILPGVSVAGVSIGGMAPADARILLADRLRGLSEGGLGIAIIRSIADELEIGPRADGTGSRLRFVKVLTT